MFMRYCVSVLQSHIIQVVLFFCAYFFLIFVYKANNIERTHQQLWPTDGQLNWPEPSGLDEHGPSLELIQKYLHCVNKTNTTFKVDKNEKTSSDDSFGTNTMIIFKQMNVFKEAQTSPATIYISG